MNWYYEIVFENHVILSKIFKRVHIMWFHFCEVVEQARFNLSSSKLMMIHVNEVQLTEKEQEGTFLSNGEILSFTLDSIYMNLVIVKA